MNLSNMPNIITKYIQIYIIYTKLYLLKLQKNIYYINY